MGTARVRHGLVLSLALLGIVHLGVDRPRIAPEVSAEVQLNSEPLSLQALRGQVVLVEFWTFACWNCKNVEPHVKRWHEHSDADGLVVLAIHTPELRFERDVEKVKEYVEQNGIAYPVAVENDFSTQRAFENLAWPSLYLIARDGVIRHTRVGDGGYTETEAKIRELLVEPFSAAE